MLLALPSCSQKEYLIALPSYSQKVCPLFCLLFIERILHCIVKLYIRLMGLQQVFITLRPGVKDILTCPADVTSTLCTLHMLASANFFNLNVTFRAQSSIGRILKYPFLQSVVNILVVLINFAGHPCMILHVTLSA